MTNSEQVIERFSTYLYLTDSDSGRRLAPKKLSDRAYQNFMQTYLEVQGSENDVEFWSRWFLRSLLYPPDIYWLRDRSDTLGTSISDCWIAAFIQNNLLFFYLQPVCWETALNLDLKLRQAVQTTGFSITDYFSHACESSLTPSKLLKTFDFESATSLHVFSKIVLQRKTRNQVVKELKNKTIKFTGYGLLNNTSASVIEEALKVYGISYDSIYSYKLICQAFKDYLKTHRKSAEAQQASRSRTIEIDSKAAQAIAKRFNSQIRRLSSKNISAISESDVISYLEVAIKAVQLLEGQRTISLDAFERELPEAASALEAYSPESALPDDEKSPAKSLISEAFEALEPMGKSALVLWLGLEINQSDFIGVLEVEQQYQVARCFQKYQRSLLKMIVQKAIEGPSNTRNLSSIDMNALGKEKLFLIKDYLKIFSHQKLSHLLETTLFRELSSSERKALREWISRPDVGAYHPTDEMAEDIALLPELLKAEEKFASEIETTFKLSLKSLASAHARGRKFIVSWLANNQAVL